MHIKDHFKALKSSRFLTGRLFYQILKHCAHIGKLLNDGAYRSLHFTKLQFSGNYYQIDFYTLNNRYPLLFRQCRHYLSAVPNPRILSFGCSTGEEVFTIGRYMPGASIMGVDINKWCIKQCKKKHTDQRFSFYHRFSIEFDKACDFDAIFCMAVFQRTENRTRTSEISNSITFEQFEQDILMLDKKLKPGGLFTIEFSDFSFTDTACSDHYRPLVFEKNKLSRNRPLFGKDNKKIQDGQDQFRMFVKCTGDKTDA